MYETGEICLSDTSGMEWDQNLVLDLSVCELIGLNSRTTKYWAITPDHLGQNPSQGSARFRLRLSVPHLSVSQQTPVPECHGPQPAFGSLWQGPSLGLEPRAAISFNSVTFSLPPCRKDLIPDCMAEHKNLSFYDAVPTWICTYERQDMSTNNGTDTVNYHRKPWIKLCQTFQYYVKCDESMAVADDRRPPCSDPLPLWVCTRKGRIISTNTRTDNINVLRTEHSLYR